MNKIWSLPILSVYFYAVTILTQYGYNSYFNIPSSFIGASIGDNVVYFFHLFQVAAVVAGLMSWWMWIVAISAIAIITVIYFFDSWYNIFLDLIAVLIMGMFLWGSYGFGGLLASSVTNFRVLSSDCPQIGSDNFYIIPVISETKAVLIPIDVETKKMKGGFMVRDLSGLTCKIVSQEVGKIIK